MTILEFFFKSDKGKNWTWVNGEKVDTGLYPQTYRYDSFAWFCATKNLCYQKPRGEGPHCLVIEAASSYFNDIWLVKRCAYEQFFICEVPKSVVIPPLEDPAGVDSINQSINQSTNQSINQSINQSSIHA